MKRTTMATLAVALGLSLYLGTQAAPDELRAGTPDITDGEIAMIAVVAGGIDVRYAHLALALSSNEEVRAFARTMLQDHPAVNAQAGALVEKLGIEPVPSDVSRQLERESRAIVDELSKLRGAAFDRRYARNELAYHEFVNTALREQFIPGAEHEKFRAALETALSVFEGHERLARAMVESVTD